MRERRAKRGRHAMDTGNEAEYGSMPQAGSHGYDIDTENEAEYGGMPQAGRHWHDIETDNEAEVFMSDSAAFGHDEGRENNTHQYDDDTEGDIERECYNCHQPDHNISNCRFACGRCGERGHKARGCTVACKCKNFPGHRLEFCPVICTGIVCKNRAKHKAVECNVCCICGSREDYA